jgi:hypothetical protein
LHYVEVGNEDWFDRSGSYDERFAQFYDAIKAKYPQLQVIATTKVKSRVPDVLDEHYYRSQEEMELHALDYDKYIPAPTTRKFSAANGPRASARPRRTWRARSATPRG